MLTTETRQFSKGNQTEFSIDLGIVRCVDGQWQRLIHQKTGIADWDRYIWNEARNSRGLEERVCALKERGLWLKVRSVYLKKKNFYLKQNDTDHPSFIVYIEAVNEVYYDCQNAMARSIIFSMQ